MFELIINNIKYLLQKSLKIAFAISTAVSIFEIAICKIIDDSTATFKTLVILCLVFVGLYATIFIVISLWLNCRKNIKVFSTDKHSVYLHFEDLLNNDIINNKFKHKNIVISANRCFDTIVNNELISDNTLQGKVFKNLYDEKKYTRETLQETINSCLNNEEYDIVRKEDKPQGNLKRYRVGTVAKVDDSNTKSYYLLAMSTFDKNLNSYTTKSDFVLSIQRLIEYCDKKSQGYPVLMPLLGSGLSRTRLDCNSDILRFIIDALRLNKDILNCDFHIYIRRQDKSKINFYNLI